MEAAKENQKPNRRTLQKEETRRFILESAYELFQTLGYEQTTMRKLAKFSGVGLGTVFKHFPDKPSLLVAAFQEDIQAVTDNAFATLPQNDIHQQLTYIVAEVYRYYARNQVFSRALVKEALFITGTAGESMHAHAMAFLQSIGAMLEAAAKRGEIAPIGDRMAATMAFWSFYLLGLTMGLRSESFDVNAQAVMVKSLLLTHFPPQEKQ